MTLPKRWTKLDYHKIQQELYETLNRFVVVPAGRRSGKTELAKRKLVKALTIPKEWDDPRYFAAAPTRDQAKRIYWDDLKKLVPKEWVKRISETDLCIRTVFGSELWVVGMDKPERIEGVSWDGGVLDEYANMKPKAWGENIRPALSDRQGWCWLIGVPEGRNHYYDIVQDVKSGRLTDWGLYTWHSSDILPKSEIDAAKLELDERTFRQEYEASFEDATGQVYYAYDIKTHLDDTLQIIKGQPLILCVDFNVDPCVWEVCQYDGKTVNVLDEIALRNTNTEAMTKEYLNRYPNQKTIIYGDSAGSSRTTAGESDYIIMRRMGLTDQRIKRANPRVKDRVNSVNSMLRNASGDVRIKHTSKCKMLEKDFHKVTWRNGDIDKRDGERTHATDAFGYYIESEFGFNKYTPDPKLKFYK